MNKLNLQRLKNLYDLGADMDGNHLRLQIRTVRDGVAAALMTGYAKARLHESDRFTAATQHLNNPERRFFYEYDPPIEIVAHVLDALGRQGKAITAAAGDSSLSGDGKAARCLSATTEALTAIGNHFAKLLAIGKQLDADEHKLFDPPALDAISVVLDSEIRSRYFSLPRVEQLKLLKLATMPEGAALLLALKRSPLPLTDEDAELVGDAWAAKVAADKPEAVSAYQIARENYEWSVGLTKHIAGIIANQNLNGTTGQLDRKALYKIMIPTKGESVLDFTPSEVKLLDRLAA